jgi:hypothetical protein
VKQRRLRFLRKGAGAVCLVAFAGKSVSVEAGFLHQGERVRDKAKLVLRYRQAASVSFHGGLSRLLVGGEVTAVFPARVKVGSLRHLPARVLPNLPCVVPMETKLRENGGNLRGLLSLKLNPNPFAYYFGNIPEVRGFLPNQVKQGFNRQCPILISQFQVNLRQLCLVFDALCGPVLEL